MQSYADFAYGGNEDGKMWSSFIQKTNNGGYDDFDPPLYSPIFPATLPVQSSVLDYSQRHSLDFVSFQDLIERRNSCLANLGLTAKEAEALRQENVNLQMANSELNKQLSQLKQYGADDGSFSGLQSYGNGKTVFPSVNSVANKFKHMRIGEKGSMVTKKPVAVVEVENMEPVKKTEADRVKLPKSISVRSNGYLKAVVPNDGSAGRAHAVQRVKLPSDMQKVFVHGKKEEEPLELKVYNQGMTKTELCNKWQQTGACPYGDHCQFAHGIEELRLVIRHPRYKTEVCRMVLAGDPCPYGHRCHFRHALTEEEEKLMTHNISSS